MKITKSRLKEIIREEYQAIKEADMESEKIPGDLKRFMDKFIDKLKDKKLTRNS